MDFTRFVEQANVLADEIIALRWEFHRHPETGFLDHHNLRFNFDEAALPMASSLMAVSAWSLLEAS